MALASLSRAGARSSRLPERGTEDPGRSAGEVRAQCVWKSLNFRQPPGWSPDVARGHPRGMGLAILTSQTGDCPVSRQERSMRIGGVGGSTIPPRRAAARGEPHLAAAEAHALIPVGAPAAPDHTSPRTRHPSAPFLAQLIATQLQLPQTRARRRAEPEDAIAAYGRTGVTPIRRRFGKQA